MNTYSHKVQYYETDQMKIVHHSNYIRWFEEARIDYMEQIGVSYAALEEKGFISPVLSVNCDFKSMTRFGETVLILTELKEFKNVKYKFSYTVLDSVTKELRAKGESSHCFIDSDGNVISLKREDKNLFELFQREVSNS